MKHDVLSYAARIDPGSKRNKHKMSTALDETSLALQEIGMFRWPAHLSQLPDAIWQRLATACNDTADPFRLPAIATLASAAPTIRTVVLRNSDALQRTLTFYSDSRAPKLAELAAQPQNAWLFYDPRDRTQIRARGVATVHQMDLVSSRTWNQLPEFQQAIYTTEFAPGSPIAAPCPNPLNTSGHPHFAVVVTTIEQLEWLQLGEPFHQRASFAFEDGQWRGHWVAP